MLYNFVISNIFSIFAAEIILFSCKFHQTIILFSCKKVGKNSVSGTLYTLLYIVTHTNKE